MDKDSIEQCKIEFKQKKMKFAKDVMELMNKFNDETGCFIRHIGISGEVHPMSKETMFTYIDDIETTIDD